VAVRPTGLVILVARDNVEDAEPPPSTDGISSPVLREFRLCAAIKARSWLSSPTEPPTV
jgi:hypothetical protein